MPSVNNFKFSPHNFLTKYSDSKTITPTEIFYWFFPYFLFFFFRKTSSTSVPTTEKQDIVTITNAGLKQLHLEKEKKRKIVFKRSFKHVLETRFRGKPLMRLNRWFMEIILFFSIVFWQNSTLLFTQEEEFAKRDISMILWFSTDGKPASRRRNSPRDRE